MEVRDVDALDRSSTEDPTDDVGVAPPVVGVLVAYRTGDWFDTTLQSLAAQDYPNLRWVVLLAETPEADAIQTAIAGHLPDAFVRRTDPMAGFGPTANEILDLVEGENGFFLICHDDVAPERDAVRTMVAELYRANAGVVGPKLVAWDDPRRLLDLGSLMDRYGDLVPVVEPGEIDQQQHDDQGEVDIVPSAFMLVRADLFRRLGGFDPAMALHGEDRELCWRAALSGARVLVAPAARVRHREQLEVRRPDLDHRGLRERHRLRAVMTSSARVVRRAVSVMVMGVAELIVATFTGRFGEAWTNLRAIVGLVPRAGGLRARRRVVQAAATFSPEEYDAHLIARSTRLAMYARGRETATYLGVDSTVRRWRPTSPWPLVTWVVVVMLVLIGSRSFIDDGVPQVGEFLAFPQSPLDLARLYLSGWDPRSTGVTAATPSGWFGLSLYSVVALFRMPLAMTIAVIALMFAGAAGAWRLAAVFPMVQARVAAMVVYIGTPLVPGIMATGSFTALVWYAVLPWAVYLLRRLAGIGTADPALAESDLVDAVAEVAPRDRWRILAGLALLLATATAFAPVVIVLWLVVGLVLVAMTLVAGGSTQTATWFGLGTVGGAVAAAILNLPWSLSWSWSSMVAGASVDGEGLVAVLGLSVDGRGFAALTLALYLTAFVALAVARAWRLTWAIRGAGLIVVFGVLAVVADRGALPFDPPPLGTLMAPIALGLALGGAAVAGGFGADVMRRGFGWRQPVAIVANLAIVVGVVPAILAVGNGGWNAPRTTLADLLAVQLPADPIDGDYRVLIVGTPESIPVAPSAYRPGIGFAIVDDGPLQFTQRWAPPVTDGDAAVAAVLDAVASGATLRAGELLAPYGIRYVVIPDGAPIGGGEIAEVPAGLVERLERQLDLASTFGAPSLTVFRNNSWIANTALLPVDDPSEPDRDARTVFAGAGPLVVVDDAVGPGVVHLATGFDDRWWVSVGDDRLTARTGFETTTAFDVPADIAPGTPAALGYDRSPMRVVWVVVQVMLWSAVALVMTRLRLVRRRGVSIEPAGGPVLVLAGEPVATDEIVFGVADDPARDPADGLADGLADDPDEFADTALEVDGDPWEGR